MGIVMGWMMRQNRGNEVGEYEGEEGFRGLLLCED